MSSAHDSLNRASWLTDLKRGITIKSAFRLVIDTAPLEYSTEDELEAALDLFEEILRSEKTLPQKCRPENCEGCGWYNFCEMWDFQQLLRESNTAMHEYEELERQRISEKKKSDTRQVWSNETLAMRHAEEDRVRRREFGVV